jgi:hypothetical protein
MCTPALEIKIILTQPPPPPPPPPPHPPATIRLHLQLARSTSLFDLSGRLPFSIVFGLARDRRHDPRPDEDLVLDTRRSLLDVPWALREGLLDWDVLSTDPGGGIMREVARGLRELDVDGGDGGDGDGEDDGSGEGRGMQRERFIVLKSLVGRTENFMQLLTLYEYVVDPASPLGEIFSSGGAGVKFEISLLRPELGIRWYRFGKKGDFIGEDGEFLPRALRGGGDDDTAGGGLPPLSHRHGTSVGRCTFQTVACLSWPPNLSTHISVVKGSETSPSSYLRISVSHSSSQPLMLQTTGEQRHLKISSRYGLNGDEQYWSRILHEYSGNSKRALRLIIRVLDASTREVVYGGVPGFFCRLRDMRKPFDPRPKKGWMATILPGETLERKVEISEILKDLPDGEFEVHLEPLGMWWCEGEIGTPDDEDDGRLPKRFWRENVPPAMLEADPLKFRVIGGVLV